MVSNFRLWKSIYLFASTKNLFVHFRRRYSQQIVDNLNHVLKLKGKATRSTVNIKFLKDCLEKYVTPTYIRQRVRKTKPKRPWAIEKAFLCDDINKELDFSEQTNDEYKRKLSGVLKRITTFDQFRFSKLLTETATRLEREASTKKKNYLQWLCKSQLGQGELTHESIVNLTDVVLTETQKDVLCRGLNFGIPPSSKLKESIQSEFELCWEQLSELPPVTEERKHDCRTAMAEICRQYTNQKPDTRGYPLNKQHFDTIRELRKNNEIIITRPDKGNGVVLLSRDDYVQKMETILSDLTKFCRIGKVEEHDRTVQQERALQAFLLRAKNNKHLSKDVYERIRPVGASRPRMYGVPKLHKKGTPLRPILSMVNAPQHAMAKWLTEVLRPVVDKYSQHTIKDSFEFCNILDEFDARNSFDSDSSFMCSFDICSLFTNIPLDETINLCLDALYRDDFIKQPPVPETLLKKMLLKATTEVEFSFNDDMYRQVDGVAMGSPLGPVLANIFVGFCETKIAKEDLPELYH